MPARQPKRPEPSTQSRLPTASRLGRALDWYQLHPRQGSAPEGDTHVLVDMHIGAGRGELALVLFREDRDHLGSPQLPQPDTQVALAGVVRVEEAAGQIAPDHLMQEVSLRAFDAALQHPRRG